MKYKNEVKIGIMGMLALVILFVGINFLKGMKLFSSESLYYIEFAHAKELSNNSPVFANGYNVGRVSNVCYNFEKPGRVIVEIAVDKRLRIPQKAKAILDEAMLGGCTLNLELSGEMGEMLNPGDTIIGSDANGLMEKAADMLPQVQPILAKMDSLITHLDYLVSNPALTKTLNNISSLSENLNNSSIQLNKLMGEELPLMTKQFNQVGSNLVVLTNNLNQMDLQATLQEVDKTIQHVDQMVQQMQSEEGTLGKFMKNPSLYNELDRTAKNAADLFEDLKANPKRYVNISVFGKK